MVFSVRAGLLLLTLVAVLALAVETRTLFPIVATVLLVQVLIATAPAPTDDRGVAIPTPQMVPTMVTGVVSAAVAYHPELLFGAATRASLEGLRQGVFAGLLPAVAAGLLAAIVAQVVRRDERQNLVASLSAVVTMALFAGLVSAWIAALREPMGREAALAACAAIGTAFAVSLAPGARHWLTPLSLVLAASAAVGTTHLLEGTATVPFAALLGVAVAGFALLGFAVGEVWTDGRTHLPSAWALPGALALSLAAPVVYVAGDLLTAMG